MASEDQPAAAAGSLAAILGDRKAMEQERLARLAKKRGTPDATKDDSATKDSKRQKQDETPADSISLKEQMLDPLVSRPALTATPASTSAPTQHGQASASRASTTQAPASWQYPYGTIKQTWAFGYPRKNDIKIEEVLRKAELKIALLSSWVVDMDWVVSKLNLQHTKLIFVFGEQNEGKKQAHIDGAKAWGKQLRLCFPPMGKGQYVCMHSKLMLLFHRDSLRVVVPSANLIPFDWGETGVMQNTIFLIDLPRLPESRQGERNDTLTQFSRELIHFAEAMQVDKGVTDKTQQVRAGLLKFDYSKTKHIAFVHSIGTTHIGADGAVSTGYPLLSSAVRALGLQTQLNQPIQIDYTASSIGSLTTERVELMCRALRGLPTLVPDSAKKKVPPEEKVPLHERFRIYFPSDETVRNSLGGPENGGTLFMAKSWSEPKFPSALLRDGVARRPGLLSHSKLILVRTPRGAFAYTGSANLSQSAWGWVTWDARGKTPKLYCPNWECGVLVRGRRPEGVAEEDVDTADEADVDTDEAEDDIKLDGDGVVPMEALAELLDVPFEVPSRGYGDGVVPWMQPGR